MLNPFPHLLNYGFFAPTLLRVTVACLMFFIAQQAWLGAKTIAAIPFPLVGKTKPWVIHIAAGITALVGLTLFFGYNTQWAALVGILIAIKLTYFRKQLGQTIGLPVLAYAFLVILCASLLLTGAGALAFDLPL
ncbi:MAG: hypothetical protein WCI89_00510 [bacterium]